MDLIIAQKKCIELMEKHGLTEEKGWSFEWINSKNVAGRCRTFGTTSGGVIMLSKFVTQHHDEAEVLNTILHEISHGLTPGHGHDQVWQRKALEIGCNGKRCFDVNDSETLKKARKAISKYTGVCPKCNEEFYTNRLPKRDLWHSSCARKVGGRYLIQDKIVYIQNGINISKPLTVKVPSFKHTYGNKNIIHSDLIDQPIDSYYNMLVKFEKEFMPWIDNDVDKFASITIDALSSSSWRTMNREVRKACDRYMFTEKKMTHQKFQSMFFYESIMLGRVKHGANAPWIGGKPC